MTAPIPPPPAPPKAAPPPPKPSRNGAFPGAAQTKKFAVQSGVRADFQRIIVYGPGGAGKSSLAASLKEVGIKPLFLDIGNGTGFLDVDRIEGIGSWDELRGVLHDEPIWNGFGAVVIDDLTKAEELAVRWTIENVPHEKKEKAIRSIEDYGFGKGLTHTYETFLTILADLDAHIRAGRQVVCIAHECTASVPNPGGVDFIRYEPRLQSPASGKNSVRHRVKEWCDHMFFIGYDTFVNESGKAQGGGSRTIFPAEMPTHWAKSRCMSEPIVYERGSCELWKSLFGKGK